MINQKAPVIEIGAFCDGWRFIMYSGVAKVSGIFTSVLSGIVFVINGIFVTVLKKSTVACPDRTGFLVFKHA